MDVLPDTKVEGSRYETHMPNKVIKYSCEACL